MSTKTSKNSLTPAYRNLQNYLVVKLRKKLSESQIKLIDENLLSYFVPRRNESDSRVLDYYFRTLDYLFDEAFGKEVPNVFHPKSSTKFPYLAEVIANVFHQTTAKKAAASEGITVNEFVSGWITGNDYYLGFTPQDVQEMNRAIEQNRDLLKYLGNGSYTVFESGDSEEWDALCKKTPAFANLTKLVARWN